jgi:hypothetical protein
MRDPALAACFIPAKLSSATFLAQHPALSDAETSHHVGATPRDG